MQNNGSPKFWNHDRSLSADSWAAFVFAVWLGSDSNGAKNIHDQVCPEHLHDIQWRVADGSASENRDEADDDVDGNLELQEFPTIVVEGSAPFDRSVNGVEIVIQNNKVGVVLGNVATRSHAQSNIGLSERLGIGDAVSGHSNKTTSILDGLNYDEFFLRSASGDNLDLFLEFIKSLRALQFDYKLKSLWVPNFSVASKFGEEFLSVHKGEWLLSLLFGDNSGLNGDMSCSFWVVTGQNSNSNFGFAGRDVYIGYVLTVLESLNIRVETVSNGVFKAESAQIGQIGLNLLPKLV